MRRLSVPSTRFDLASAQTAKFRGNTRRGPTQPSGRDFRARVTAIGHQQGGWRNNFPQYRTPHTRIFRRGRQTPQSPAPQNPIATRELCPHTARTRCVSRHAKEARRRCVYYWRLRYTCAHGEAEEASREERASPLAGERTRALTSETMRRRS